MLPRVGFSQQPVRFYHDLETQSGLGDRLADLLGVLTVAHLLAPGVPVDVYWGAGRRYGSFNAVYEAGLFEHPLVRVIAAPRTDGLELEGGFSHYDLRDDLHPGPNGAPGGIVELGGGEFQLILRRGRIWGNNSPANLVNDSGFHGLEDSAQAAEINAGYQKMASMLTPSPTVERAMPADLAGRVGVHIRLGDKLVETETEIDMDAETWQRIERAGLAYLELCVRRGHGLFLCSDDRPYLDDLVGRLRSQGADVVTASPVDPEGAKQGEGAVIDLFALSQCRSVVQMTKYSTFSIVAALIGGIPLANLHQDVKGIGNRLEIWNSVLALTGYRT